MAHAEAWMVEGQNAKGDKVAVGIEDSKRLKLGSTAARLNPKLKTLNSKL